MRLDVLARKPGTSSECQDEHDDASCLTRLALHLPTFGFVVATLAILGVGIGLLLSERLPAERRRTIGVTLSASARPRLCQRLQRCYAPGVSRNSISLLPDQLQTRWPPRIGKPVRLGSKALTW